LSSARPALPAIKQAATVATSAGALKTARRATAASEYGLLPLSFEANQGQFEESVMFYARAGAYNVAVATSGAELEAFEPAGKSQRIRLSFTNSKAPSAVFGEERLPGVTNYMAGEDPRKWKTGILNFKRVRARNVYRGIDVV